MSSDCLPGTAYKPLQQLELRGLFCVTSILWITTCIHWLVKHRLLKNNCFCKMCEVLMNFVKKANVKDKYRWQCKRCRGGTSIREGSFFIRSHLSLNQVIIIVYYLCYDLSKKDIARKAGLGPRSTHALLISVTSAGICVSRTTSITQRL